jgi:plastocyanin
MNRFFPSRRSALSTLVCVGLLTVLATGYAVAAGFVVTLGATGPTPPVQTVAWGDTVTWTNGDTVPHQLQSSRAGFSSETIPTAGSYTHTYTAAGSGNYGYRQIGPKKSYSGSIVVTVSGSVTLKASKTLVTFGQPLTLAGRSTVLGYPVVIEQRGAGGGWTTLAEVPVGPDGAFSTRLLPKVGAHFRASAAAGQLISPQLTVKVVPVVTAKARFTKARTGAIVPVVVRVNPQTAATTASLFLYVASRKRWVRAAPSVAVKSGVAVFRWKALPGRTLLRGWLVKADLAPGFSPSFSRTILVTTPPAPPKHKHG